MAQFGGPVHVIGATGRTGAVLCRLLAGRGTLVVAVVRDRARWAAMGVNGEVRAADLTAPDKLRTALADATRIVSVSYAAWAGTVLDAAPDGARVVITGTARRYSPLPDPDGEAARQAERLVLGSGRDAAILHPTMIYGAPNDGTIGRLARLVRRWPILALPAGGRFRVQPVHVADVAAALTAAVDRRWQAPAAIPVGGPEAITYAALVRAVARAEKVRPPAIVAIPAALARLASGRHPAVLRLLEDRLVDIGAMRALLGVSPRPIAEGLFRD